MRLTVAHCKAHYLANPDKQKWESTLLPSYTPRVLEWCNICHNNNKKLTGGGGYLSNQRPNLARMQHYIWRSRQNVIKILGHIQCRSCLLAPQTSTCAMELPFPLISPGALHTPSKSTPVLEEPLDRFGGHTQERGFCICSIGYNPPYSSSTPYVARLFTFQRWLKTFCCLMQMTKWHPALSHA